ncbi:TrfB-related DNA-binding protein [Pseudomonas syringae pv. coryli]|uniref:TrfB-related DNA-binding protein n=1 Tax=Pseudomonas syringae pv. coryli TaxID=317659 RepID=UPI003D2CC2D7
MPKAPTQEESTNARKATPAEDAPPRQRGERGKDKVKRTKSRILTAIEFEAVRPFLGISEDRIAAARLAMVEEKKFTEVAEAFGWKSRQSVDRAVSIVWDRYQKYKESQASVAALEAQQQPARKKPATKKPTDGQ